MKKLIILLMFFASTVYAGTRIETQDFVFSNATVKIVGTNEATDSLGYGGNGLQIDGGIHVDKNLLFLDGGKKTFTFMTYRNEGGKFFYLHDYETQKQPLVVSRTGRFGINKLPNIPSYHTMGPWADASSDLELDTQLTAYTKNRQLSYRITVDGTNAVADTYKIETANDFSSAYTLMSTCNVMSATSTNYFGNNIWAYWTQLTGHTIGQQYYFLGIPQLPRATLGVSPIFIDEVILSTNFRAATPTWIDRTFEANSSEIGTYKPFRNGTNSALYIGMCVPNNAFYVNVVTPGVGIVAVREYWDGGSWKAISNVVDNTLNYTTSGEITFDSDLMPDWACTNLTVDTYTNLYYWMRMYSTNTVTTEAVVQDITRHGSYRLNAYEAPLDSSPKMSVTADGTTWLSGYPLTIRIVETFYLKFLAQCSTQTTATATSTITPFVTEVSDIYNVYSNSSWYPNSTSLVRMNWSIRTAGTLAAGRGFYVVLFENGVESRDIGICVSGDNSDVPIVNGTYIFKPSSSTNYYNLGLRRFSGNNVTCAGGNTNWWFGEKIQ